MNTSGKMETEKCEYDSAIGGCVDVPDMLSTYKYATNRLDEVKTLMNEVDNPKQTKLIFQTLPKHMRRRAMTHNPKRLPRRYRQAHIGQMTKSGVPEKSKRPSRKYRRKPDNLIDEYKRRQEHHTWLETHIWHAKRFHMKNAWGYRLPYKTCDKTFRSSYRATSKHCLIQDISYIGCIELTGPLDLLKIGFDRISTNKCGGLSIYAKAYINGYREGAIDIFKMDSYPYNGLGRIRFMWKPMALDDQSNSSVQLRTVWIFAHPLFYQELFNELIKLFELLTIEMTDNKINELCPSECFINKTSSIQLSKLKDKLNRFRLTGPLSQSVLAKAFHIKQLKDSQTKTNDWMLEFYSKRNEQLNMAQLEQIRYWNSIKHIKSPGELCPSMILAINIEDPRINRPRRRTKALPITNDERDELNNCENLKLEILKDNAISSIWIEKYRLKILHDKMTTKEYCELRNKHCLVPGERCTFENEMQGIPILLIQRPGCQSDKFKKSGYGSGWDVIVPAGYGISTWISLIMWGAKAGGVREYDTVNRESGIDEFLPDTLCGQKMSEYYENEFRNRYFSKPPNKRMNYNKLSIASPFICPWVQLLREWTKISINNEILWFVLRESDKIGELNRVLQSRNLKSILSIGIPENCLIPFYLIMDDRGNPDNNSIICLPKKCDIQNNKNNRRRLLNEPIYTEPLAPDTNEDERKELKSKHVKLLKRLRRRRLGDKRKQQELSEHRVIIAKPQTTKLITEHYRKMCELWLPKQPTAIRKQCSRDVIGYLNVSDFSFTEAIVCGIGYITSNGLEQLKRVSIKYMNGQLKVLVRATNTRHYRFATVKLRTG